MAAPQTPTSGPAASTASSNSNTNAAHNGAVNNNSNGNMASKADGAGSGAATPAGQQGARGEAPVSMAKSSAPVAAKSSLPINFGTVQDQNAMLSSSPAGPASQMTGAPTKFGSVAADASKPKDKAIGFAGKGEAPRQLDFNKMFQGGGSSKPTNGNAAPTSEAHSGDAANASAALSPSTARPPTLGVRPPNVARPYDAQRVPSQQGGNGMQGSMGARTLSGNQAAFVPQHNQQPRSPSMAPNHMQQMQHQMNGPPQNWHQQQQQQQHMYYMMNYGGYPGVPQGVPPHMAHQYQQQQHGYDMSQGQARSPRHMAANAMGGGNNAAGHNGAGMPSTPTAASSGVQSPAVSQRSVPQTPNMASPAPAHTPGGRPPLFTPGASSFSHSPSPSFGAGSMSAAAQHFEPGKSRAIAIVNPNTKQAVEFKNAPSKGTTTPTTPSAGATTPGTPAQSNASATTVASPAPAPVPAAAASSPAPAPAAKAASPAPASPSPAPRKAPTQEGNKAVTHEDFQRRVHEAALAAKKAKEEKAAAAAAATGGGEEAARKAKEEEAARKAKESEAAEAAQKAAEEEERKRRAEEDAAAKKKADEAAEADKKEKADVDAKEKARAEAAAAAAAPATPKKAPAEATGTQASMHAPDSTPKIREPPASIDVPANEMRLGTLPSTPSFRGSADVERMAREASSIPSTPLDGMPPRLPPTPRTPGTPGFANLPAKPMASHASSGGANGITLDPNALERRRKSNASQSASSDPAPQQSAAPAQPTVKEPSPEKLDEEASTSNQASALGNARFIEDIRTVTYPEKYSSPAPELNASAEPGKFRYDRDFLMQFMEVYKEKPADLPPLAQIGMDSSQALAPRGAPGRRASGMGPPAAPGRNGVGLGLGLGKGGMGQFSHPPKTSEERFAASQAARGGGAFGSSGPMGSFSAGARSQPISRGGSGGAIPTRESMGTGVPAGGRTASRRGKDRRDGSRPAASNLTIPLDQIVPLELSENRWQGNRGANLKADSPELVTRKVKSLLNKLTLEKFDSISTQILEWANKSRDEKDGQTLRIVIALIFEKATDEAAWSEMYATLCRKIMEKLDPAVSDENIKTNDSKPVVGGQLFRKYLLNRCQEDFERGWAQRDATAAAAKSKEAEDTAKRLQNEADEAANKEKADRGEKAEDKEAVMLSEEYYEAQKAKRRGLGLVRFIGELYKLGLITEKIMHLCVQKLLSNTQTPEEEEVESLCKLLTTVGKLLDEGKARNYVDVYFQRMGEMMNQPAMTSRMKFMLQDLIELRQAHWRPRHDSTPKTIAEIHADAAKAKAQAEMDRHRSYMGGSMSRGGSRRGQGRDQYGADGFITVGNQPPAPAHQTKAGNLSAFGKGIDRGGASRPLSVGPQSVFARKNQKSEDGSNPPSRTASSQNIFHLLGEQGQPSGEDASSGRPKLNLAKRTKPLPGEEGADAEADAKADGEDEGEEEAGAAASTELSDEEAKRRIDNDIKELFAIKDVDEGKLAFEALPADRRREFIDKVAGVVLERVEAEVRLVGSLLSTARDEGLLDDELMEQGIKGHIEFLDDIAVDAPKAYDFMAILLVASELPQETIEKLAGTITGEGIKPPSERLLAKVAAEREQQDKEE